MAGELDAFYTTWSQARETYGQGTPVTGERFDSSSTLNGFSKQMEAAAPGDRWTGAASESYGDATSRHQQIVGRVAEADRKLAGQVTNAANIVSTGRTNLDELRKWVTDAAATTTDDQAGRTMKMQIASRGLAQLTEIMTGTHGEIQTVKGNIDKITGEYDGINGDIQLLGGEDGDGDGEPDDETPEEKAEREAKERAEQDVQDALGGNTDAAGRVDEVLDSIEPGQPLSPEQGSYLSQMQAQMQGMSVERMHEVEGQLGDHNDIFGDAMQLMSNDDVTYPQTDLEVGALDDAGETMQGGFDKLPASVQETLNSPDVVHMDRLDKIADMVSNGDDRFQTNTDLDRGMLRKAADVMDSPFWQQSPEEYPGGSMDRGIHPFDPTVSNVFDAVSPDHGAIHDAITTGPGHIEGIDSDKFMEGVTHRNWADDGKAAGELFEWTRNDTGPESVIAAETAHAYATYLGDHSTELLTLGGTENTPGFHQIGDVNPSLVQAFSTGLLPYQDEMVEAKPGWDTAFGPLDDLGSDMDTTKGLFAVIDTQPDAAREWNRAAYQNAMDMQQSFADLARDNPGLTGADQRLDDLQSSARMLAVIDGGMNQETLSNIQNGHMSREDALLNANEAYEFKKQLLGDVLGYAPGGGLVTGTAADALAGPPPNADNFTFDEKGTITDIGLKPTEQLVQHQITQAQYTVASEFIRDSNPYIDPKFFDVDGSLKAPSEISDTDWSEYDAQLTVAMSGQAEINAMLGKFKDTFSLINGGFG